MASQKGNRPVSDKPGKSVISYDEREMKVGSSMKKNPKPSTGVVKGSK